MKQLLCAVIIALCTHTAHAMSAMQEHLNHNRYEQATQLINNLSMSELQQTQEYIETLKQRRLRTITYCKGSMLNPFAGFASYLLEPSSELAKIYVRICARMKQKSRL